MLECVREGASNAEIAGHLNVSINTVRYHVSNMLAKLELRDRSELAAWDGRPAQASRSTFKRFSLAAPLAWLRESAWPAKAAAGGGVVALSVAGLVTIAALNSTGAGLAPPPASVATITVESPSEPMDTTTASELHTLGAAAQKRAEDAISDPELRQVIILPEEATSIFVFVDGAGSEVIQIDAIAGEPSDHWTIDTDTDPENRYLWPGGPPRIELSDVQIDIADVLTNLETAHSGRTSSVTVWNDRGTVAIRASVVLRDIVGVSLLIDPATGELLDYPTGAPFTGF